VNCYCYTIFDLKVKEIPPLEAAMEWILEVCEHFDFGVRDVAKMSFPSPVPGSHAYTVVAVLSASHVAVHTAPESSWVEIAFACCRQVAKGELLLKVEEFFKPENVRVTSFTGSVPKNDVL
jgi:S-adenosylmethionine/arginine decarboxylase-like enzyme